MRYKCLLYSILIYALKHYVPCPWNYASNTFKIYFLYNSSMTEATLDHFSQMHINSRVIVREIDTLGSLF